MRKFVLELKLLSNTLIGSGEGFGAIIDTDIVFDAVGIPYIPAKRIKGCLLDSAKQVEHMFNLSKLNINIAPDNTFGKQGQEGSCPVYFSNLMIQDYEASSQWFEYLSNPSILGNLITKERIIHCFTDIRQHTKINEERGVAEDHSLRTIRFIRKGIIFTGNVEVSHCDNEEDAVNTLALACMNLTHIGTKRTRGLGEVQCTLKENKVPVTILNKVEELCKK